MIRSILCIVLVPIIVLTLLPGASVCLAQAHADFNPTGVAISQRDLLLHVRWLADDAREGREVGTPGNDTVALYIEQAFIRHGLLPAGTAGYMQDFEFQSPNQLFEHALSQLLSDSASGGAAVNAAALQATLSSLLTPSASSVAHAPSGEGTSSGTAAAIDGVPTLRARNVLGVLRGTDALRRDSVIIVGAHYDHVGWGGMSSRAAGGAPAIHNGADDNASGVAAMLELAEYFAAKPTGYSLLFIAFSAEEHGLIGSKFWMANPTIPLGRVVAMLNLDMVGRLSKEKRVLTAYGMHSSQRWSPLLDQVNTAHRFTLRRIGPGGSSDHSSFIDGGIPSLFLFTGLHEDYHTPTDDVEKLNVDGLEQVTRFASDVLAAIDRGPRPTFTESIVTTSASSSKRGLGIRLDHAWAGEGVRVFAVKKNSAADRAGLRAGDMLLRVGFEEVGTLAEYLRAMGQAREDAPLPLRIKRGNDIIELSIPQGQH
jgi:hypothetical protein